MSNNGSRLTAYAMVKFDDFGVDQFNRDDQSVTTTIRTPVQRPQEAKMTRSLTALLDPKASAKAVNDQRSLAVRIKMTDPSVTRDMDILDDVEAVWLTDDMAITLMRTAHSTFVKETEDFSCGLLTPDGITFASPKSPCSPVT